MANELILNSDNTGIWIALLKDKKLVELHHEKTSTQFAVGDIYLGQVRKVMPGLNAAFVNVGYEKDAFLHYHDLGPQIKSLNKYVKFCKQGGLKDSGLSDFSLEPEIVKTGKIEQVLQRNQNILVQIQKEPISTKGPRISSELSLAGRYMVMVPFSNQISVSKKIATFEERNRLKNLAASIKPANCGLIIRTVAEGKPIAELHKDLLVLQDKWQEVYENLTKFNPPHRALSEIDRTSSMIRDLLNDDFTHIVVNDEKVLEDIRIYVKQVSPGKEKIVKHYNGKLPIFEHFGVSKQIKFLFGKTVNLHGGSYLVIEHTEALHVIDVNSGSKTTNEQDQEENALTVNTEAAEEIARQLRLRDMGGIIVVDFIDQRNAGNKKQVYETLRNAMADDRAKHTILPMSKFGLIQITRQRVRPEMNVITTEKCPTCNGSGEINASSLIIDTIEEKMQFIVQNLNLKNIKIIAHPFVAAYLKKGVPSMRHKWILKYKTLIKVAADTSFHLGEYHFQNASGEDIIME